MIPKLALIRTEKSNSKYAQKICGLYLIERNIIILSKAGVKKIILDLSPEEKSFYFTKIIKHLKKINDIEILLNNKTGISTPYLLIPSNLFSQIQYFEEFSKYFKRKGKIYKPIITDNQFLLFNDPDFKHAVDIVKKFIIGNSGGFIAKKINKRLSMPVSLILANTRIHPNYLTVLNMIVGIFSSIFLVFNAYWYTVLGGFLFQLASIMDGIDGEVAKLTFKVSKIGAWLDTISDNLTLILFISVLSYLYYVNTGGFFPIAVIAATFIGILTMIITMIRYLKRYSKSGSLVAYDREFLQKLPQNDLFVMITQKLKYITKKEFFSLVFFAICLTGMVHFIIPGISVILLFSAAVLVVIDVKYLKIFGEEIS